MFWLLRSMLDVPVLLGGSFSHGPSWALFTHISEARCPIQLSLGQCRLTEIGTYFLMSLCLILMQKYTLASEREVWFYITSNADPPLSV